MKRNLLAVLVSSAILASCSTVPSSILPATVQDLQGTQEFSPVPGIDVKNGQYTSQNFYQVKGVVTAIQTQELGRDLPVGFFLQGESDNNPATSDGIFVETSDISKLKVGDLVDVVAKVKEDYKWTKLVDVRQVKVLQSNMPLPKPVVLNIEDKNFQQSLERYEGMLVRIEKKSDLYVTKNFGFDYGPFRNNLLLAHKGAQHHPNQHKAPTSAPDNTANDNLVVESFKRPPRGQILWYPEFGQPNGKGSTDHYIRINDLVDGLEGVVGYSYGKYRLYVTNTADKNTFIHTQDRLALPALKQGGDLRIASFNVLNYFNPPYDASRNPLHQNRGAKSEKEFQLQSDKIVNAIVRLNADIVGLMEIENNGFDDKSAVADLVNKINSKIKNPADHYTYIAPKNGEKYIGTDAISNQVLYKKNKVTLENYRIIKMPQQHAPVVRYLDGKRPKMFFGNAYQRDTVAPTFKINGTNKVLTVAVNHFKSKGSVCWEDVKDGKKLDLDKQGSCENFRVAAAYQLGSELEKIQGPKVIIGDLNSYGNEDPIMVLTNRDNAPKDHVIKSSAFTFLGSKETGKQLTDATGKVVSNTFGYVNIIRKLHPNSYSYSYNNHIGTLDYILISPQLVPSVADANDWNINAGESTLFEYANKYNCTDDGKCSHRYNDIYRASDHDPAVMDLKVTKIK